VHRGADDVCLKRQPVAIPARELHHGLHPRAEHGDRNGERRGVRMGRRVVGHIHRVDAVTKRIEPPLDPGHAAAIDDR
jgi:hypothetical protein